MSYGISGSGSLLPDFPDDPEVLFTDFLKANWSDVLSGIPLVTIDFGYEPDDNNKKGFIIKIEENFTDQYGIDLTERYTQYDMIFDAHIWERDTARYTTSKPNRALFKMRKEVERIILTNCRNGFTVGGNRLIKHMYLITSRNVREPERQDWHHAVVTFRLTTWKVAN